MIYIDCSEVVRNPHLHTGIQRVVRNVASRLSLDSGCQAVAFMGFGFVAINGLPSSSSILAVESEARRNRLATIKSIKKQLAKIKILKYFFRTFIVPIVERWRRVAREISYIVGRISGKYDFVAIKDGDVFVSLDTNWYADSFKAVRKLKKKGVVVITVVYDLIPINYPQYCDEYLCVVFEEWLGSAATISNSFLTISLDAKKSLEDYLSSQGFSCQMPSDYFYLGADLAGAVELNNLVPRHDIVELCKKKVILTVGTIEPRKRHDLIVDGFRSSMLSEDGYILVCIGRNGWKVENFLADIKLAEDYQKSIYILHDITDAELDIFYRNCELLVFASDVEGFGLPLVEARMKGKRVLASDIPVFREIADHGVSFFEAGNALSLAKELPKVLSIQEDPGVMDWLTWDEASLQFLSKVKKMASLIDQKDC
ncbi:glycosyltransferase [Chitinibacter bivalviorum]|uniref:Glycosyltransferase n=1 Tax=Chitinibacter bivalviorum TaxID=2739434 RepID=A0A7H9BMG0_9NEIS|nr:glycosyltransferase [Chitinibacter bivalviorum]QLG89659.1 glycosyltransferase [Chitinibacter bivalviorum]